MAKAVYPALRDPANSVRGVALEIIHAYVERDPEIARKYFDALLWALNDDGLSVRKRVITILSSMLHKGGIIAFDAVSTGDFDVLAKLVGELKSPRH